MGIEIIEIKNYKVDIDFLVVDDDLSIGYLDEDVEVILYDDFFVIEIEIVDLFLLKGISIDDFVRMYLKEIGKIFLFKLYEEVEFVRRMYEGDEIVK